MGQPSGNRVMGKVQSTLWEWREGKGQRQVERSECGQVDGGSLKGVLRPGPQRLSFPLGPRKLLTKVSEVVVERGSARGS